MSWQSRLAWWRQTDLEAAPPVIVRRPARMTRFVNQLELAVAIANSRVYFILLPFIAGGGLVFDNLVDDRKSSLRFIGQVVWFSALLMVTFFEMTRFDANLIPSLLVSFDFWILVYNSVGRDVVYAWDGITDAATLITGLMEIILFQLVISVDAYICERWKAESVCPNGGGAGMPRSRSARTRIHFVRFIWYC